MELKMEVYDAALTLLGILETYDAVIIDDRAFQPGSFSLESIADLYTERSFSRITSSYTLLKIIGDDIRIKKKLKNREEH